MGQPLHEETENLIVVRENLFPCRERARAAAEVRVEDALGQAIVRHKAAHTELLEATKSAHVHVQHKSL